MLETDTWGDLERQESLIKYLCHALDGWICTLLFHSISVKSVPVAVHPDKR